MDERIAALRAVLVAVARGENPDLSAFVPPLSANLVIFLALVLHDETRIEVTTFPRYAANLVRWALENDLVSARVTFKIRENEEDPPVTYRYIARQLRTLDMVGLPGVQRPQVVAFWTRDGARWEEGIDGPTIEATPDSKVFKFLDACPLWRRVDATHFAFTRPPGPRDHMERALLGVRAVRASTNMLGEQEVGGEVARLLRRATELNEPFVGPTRVLPLLARGIISNPNPAIQARRDAEVFAVLR